MIHCPFCGRRDLFKYRFNTNSVSCGNAVKSVETEFDNGDNFAIECACGCRLVKHIDQLSGELQDRMDENDWDGTSRLRVLNNPSKYLWRLMEEHWNRWAEL